jgi:hypothetical protein
MKINSCFLKALTLSLIIISFSKLTFAQSPNDFRKGFFYAGFNVRLATLASGTSIKNIMGVKFGYNYKVANNTFAGPVVDAMFIKSPINRGARISLFAGPSVDYEVSRFNKLTGLANSNYLSATTSWVFPVNPSTSDFTYLDCISLSASINKDDFYGLNKSSLDLNIDFQRYDIGFSTGASRMVNIGTGTKTTF